MATWYIYAFLSLILLGIQRFLYKVSAERKLNSARTVFSFMGTVTLLSSVFLILSWEPVHNFRFLLVVSLINSSAFLVATISNMEALKYVPSGVVYPVIRLNAGIVVIFSVIYFRDDLSLQQVAGIIIALAVMFILTRDLNHGTGSPEKQKIGLLFIALAVISGAVASISSKFAAAGSNKLAFIALSYMLSTVFSFFIKGNIEDTGAKNNEDLFLGVLMGLFNFAGFYAFLKALSIGPLSVIVSITGMHFVIAIMLSAVFYGEKLTRTRISGILLTVLSMILLRH